jgi:hemoglobin
MMSVIPDPESTCPNGAAGTQSLAEPAIKPCDAGRPHGRAETPHEQPHACGLCTVANMTMEQGLVMMSNETITLYEAIGGDATVKALARRFYELMDTLPEAARCRAIHPADLSGSEQKLYDYLTGYLGGPPVYVEKHGHPMLRRRHFMAEIGPQERDEWLLCFRRAMDETIENEKLRAIIWPPIERLAHHMQNRE